jgi:hypothetical protein
MSELHESWFDLVIATRKMLWIYSPEVLVIFGFLAGMIVMGLLLLVVTR